MEEKKNTVYTFVIVMLCLLLIGMTCYITMDKLSLYRNDIIIKNK